MLNISFNSVRDKINPDDFSVFSKLQDRANTRSLIIILSVLGGIGFLSLWLPWTQNIRTTGIVSTLNPFDKPQEVQTLINGRIEKWLVQEGQIVDVGDTLAIIKEAKDEYLDPDIYNNTMGQQRAKLLSADAYLD